MKLIGAMGVILGGAMIIGCGSAAAPIARPTTLTSAPLAAPLLADNTNTPPLRDSNPLYLTGDPEMLAAPAPVRTWGVTASELDVADADLAANPYTDAVDVYNPR